MSSSTTSASLQKSIDATKVSYKQLGRSGLRVSVPILGAMSFGAPEFMDGNWILDEEASLPLLKHAYDVGLNTWDTANIYSNGLSEEILGKAIKTYNIPRHKLVILTKCFAYVGEDTSINNSPSMQQTRDYVNQGGLSRQAIFNAVEASLRRLGTDYIDVFQIHRFDATVPISETMTALNDLVRSGKVRYIGASSMWTYQFVMMQEYAARYGLTQFVSMQNQYSLLYREEEREMNKYCDLTGVGLIPWAPLCRGILARPPDADQTQRSATSVNPVGRSDADKVVVSRVQEIAQKRGWKMSHVALAWINKRVASPIIGFSSKERIDEACDMKGKVLDDEEEKYLEEPYVPRAISGHS